MSEHIEGGAPANVLLVDDEKSIRFTLSMLLEEEGYTVLTADSGLAALELMNEHPVDVLVTDLRMGAMNGLELMEHALALDETLQVVFISAYSDVQSAVRAIKKGAFDYLIKSFTNEEFVLTIERAVERRRLIQENALIRRVLQTGDDVQGYRFKDVRMRMIVETAKRIARTTAAVLITGESGTGKEVLARLIHDNGSRRDLPFVVIDCSAIPEHLIESELFGHEKGAFTGATARRVGKFETAHTGTVFLDEIGELSPALQVKFLRVLQEKSFERVGGNNRIDVDVRFIAATNKDLAEEVKAGRFRQDLYYRLNVCALRLPPLRERREDIPVLAEHFLREFAQEYGKSLSCLDVDAVLALLNYPFPGNVRELRNMIEQATAIAADHVEVLSLRMLCGDGIMEPPDEMRDFAQRETGCISDCGAEQELTMRDYERMILVHSLRRWGGNKNKVAQTLGLRRQTLYDKLKKLGIE